MADLSKLQLVITRPLAQAEKWQRELQSQGAQTYLLPVLDIVPVSDPPETEAVKASILQLADYQKVIFVSQNAVQHAMEWIDRYWPQLPVGVQYFAVGSSTAALAGEWGLQVQAADQAMNSEALLELPALQTVKDEKVLICRGLGGRTHLGEQLRQRGAQVDYCELYHRRMPEEAVQNAQGLLRLWKQAGMNERKKVLSTHSGESLQNLSQIIDAIVEPELKHTLLSKEILLLVPGARIAELAAQLGFRRILVAENATDEAMTQALHDGI